MAVVHYDDGSDTYRVRTVNLESGSAYDTDEPADPNEVAAERELRSKYPLLCERFLDGYSESQVARGHGATVARIRQMVAVELYNAQLDPHTKSGLGHALVTMPATCRQVRDVCQSRPVL
jgi:hypothetical protein